jgi:hypothetical protein
MMAPIDPLYQSGMEVSKSHYATHIKAPSSHCNSQVWIRLYSHGRPKFDRILLGPDYLLADFLVL